MSRVTRQTIIDTRFTAITCHPASLGLLQFRSIELSWLCRPTVLTGCKRVSCNRLGLTEAGTF